MTVTGPDEQVREFLGRYVTKEDGSILNLDAIRPYPERLRELDRIAQEWDDQHPDGKPWEERPKDGFNQGGYEWCVEHWGTKWGCYKTWEGGPPIEKIEKGVVLHFSTAWSPIRTDLLVEVSARFPGLRFQYDSYEQGAGFQRHTTVANGVALTDEASEYDGERGG